LAPGFVHALVSSRAVDVVVLPDLGEPTVNDSVDLALLLGGEHWLFATLTASHRLRLISPIEWHLVVDAGDTLVAPELVEFRL
jgi:hypothetical protein